MNATNGLADGDFRPRVAFALIGKHTLLDVGLHDNHGCAIKHMRMLLLQKCASVM